MSTIIGNPIILPVGGATIEPLSVTENGTYTAPTGKAYSPVTVDVPQDSTTIEPLSVTANGTYTAPTNNAYNPVTVKVSGGEVNKNDINFYDYDGTIVASYSTAEFANLTALPDNPSHTGLTAQGWNWTLTDAKTHVASYGKLNVGQMYITDDGKTRIYIHLEDGRLAPYMGIAINGTATVDWGDGTSDTVTGTSTSTVISTQHTYTTAGDYVIAIAVSGSMALMGDSDYGSRVLWKNYTTSRNIDNNLVYQYAIQKVEIGANTSIGDYAFYFCASFTSITIPNGITSIGNAAFYYCNLISITIPSSVTSIGISTVSHCSLTSIAIPNSITSINLSGCSSLTSITIPDSVTSISFASCGSLTSITIPSSVTSIDDYAFDGCGSLTSITIPSSVTSIGKYAFNNCAKLVSITIPSSVTSIGSEAFRQCYSLASVTIPNGITTINGYAFDDCHSLTSITIPSSVTSIDNSFQCDGLGYIKFEPTTPPTVPADYLWWSDIPTDCIIYVPSGTLAAYTSAINYPSRKYYTYIEY